MATKDQLIAFYISSDDEVSRIERELIAPLKKRMADIKSLLSVKLAGDGEESSKCPHGTAYFSETDFASVADPSAFFEFVQANEAWDLMEKRAAKIAIRAFIEEKKVAVPGVNYGTKKDLHIRRPTSK